MNCFQQIELVVTKVGSNIRRVELMDDQIIMVSSLVLPSGDSHRFVVSIREFAELVQILFIPALIGWPPAPSSSDILGYCIISADRQACI